MIQYDTFNLLFIYQTVHNNRNICISRQQLKFKKYSKTRFTVDKIRHRKDVCNCLGDGNLVEKLVVTQLVKKLPSSYGPRMSIILFTKFCR